jgi:hypothetical protein
LEKVQNRGVVTVDHAADRRGRKTFGVSLFRKEASNGDELATV